ncbi:threonine/serine exporter family protein [Salinimonas lutimaris]|uniref:threonine/serine exporter family protein n=1 Tax=Salinimonas lutimaris TaxID=914153 RepID=UPI0010BFA9B1|nr:threonine/serine exporter family protein [Salinimonas lutimaris]
MNEKEFATVATHVHDARKPLNRISMQAELVKMALDGDVPPERAKQALDKIIISTKDCSEALTTMMEALSNSQPE